jgi:hypothetical protein
LKKAWPLPKGFAAMRPKELTSLRPLRNRYRKALQQKSESMAAEVRERDVIQGRFANLQS